MADDEDSWQNRLGVAFEGALKASPVIGPLVNATINPLTGERYQLWPEVMARSGLTLPGDVYSGKVPTLLGMRREDYTDIPQDLQPSDTWLGSKLGLREGKELGPSGELIARTQDLSGMAGGGFAAKPNAAVAAAKSSELAPLAALEKAPRFYSALENAVKDSNTKVASADQWLGELRNKPGVKQEELDWVLHDLPEGKIGKAELEQFVNEHKVELKEVSKGGELAYDPDKVDSRVYSRDLDNIAVRDFGQLYDHLIDSQQQQVRQAALERQNINPTKYSQWQLPGGSNYQERLLTLPENKAVGNELAKVKSEMDYLITKKQVDGGLSREDFIKFNSLLTKQKELANSNQSFQSSHWNEPNVLAHIRTNERAIPGVGNSLHIEEIQSDWHQAGRKQGYKGEAEKLKPQFDKIEQKILDSNDESIMANPELKDALGEAVKKGIITKDEAGVYQRYTQIGPEDVGQLNNPVPDAPFKSNWADLSLKRIIRQAAEEGKNAISWTPGEAQALRYQNDVRQKLNSVDWHNKQMGKPSKDGSKQILIDTASGGEVSLTVSKEGTITGGHNELKGKRLDSVLGKDIASRILEKDEGNIDAKGYVMNSEPMKAFYDKMLVDKANAIAKKFGGKVEQSNLKQTKVSIEKIEDGYAVNDVSQPHEYAGVFDTRREAEEFIKDEYGDIDHPDNSSNIHVLRLTPQLRDAALNKGFSLFADTGKVGAPLAALTRVEHNPFKLAEMEKQHGVKLTPIDENPFTSSENYANKPKQKDFINMLAEQRDFEGYQAAIRDPETRKVHTGDWHAEVLNKVAKDRGVSVDELPTNLIKGFINNKGRFLTEQQVENLSRSKAAMFRASGVPLEVGHDQEDRLIPPPPNPARIAALEPPEAAIATIGAKAGEWGLFWLARNSPRLFASLNAAWGAQLPMLVSQFMMDDIRKQVREGKAIKDIKFEEGSLADAFGLFSHLEKKYGKPAGHLRPVEGNPFANK